MAPLSHNLTDSSIDSYLDYMLHRNGWGTLCEIKAACELLNVSVRVWVKGVSYNEHMHRYETCYNEETFVPDAGTNREIALLLSNNHFTVLHKPVSMPTHRDTTSVHVPSANNALVDGIRNVSVKNQIKM